MALTFTQVPDAADVFGKTPVFVFDIQLDDAYVTDGYTINASDIGLKALIGAQVIGGNAQAPLLNFAFVTGASLNTKNLPSSLKLLAFFPSGGANASPTTMAAPTLPTGGGSTDNTITPGVGKQVASGGDLATFVLRVMFYGM